jgi:anti-sigma factor (TIGR02949 family)
VSAGGVQDHGHGPGGTPCADAADRLDLLFDGELDAAELAEVRRHLAACGPCTAEVDVREGLRALLRRGCAEEVPPALSARIRGVLTALVDEEPADG